MFTSTLITLSCQRVAGSTEEQHAAACLLLYSAGLSHFSSRVKSTFCSASAREPSKTTNMEICVGSYGWKISKCPSTSNDRPTPPTYCFIHHRVDFSFCRVSCEWRTPVFALRCFQIKISYNCRCSKWIVSFILLVYGKLWFKRTRITLQWMLNKTILSGNDCSFTTRTLDGVAMAVWQSICVCVCESGQPNTIKRLNNQVHLTICR